MAEGTGSAAETAIRKLEDFFTGLTEEERNVVSGLVRAALLQAAERFEGDRPEIAAVPGAIEAFAVPEYVTGLTGQNAPVLVRSLHFPGSLAAHSIPGCNASALVAIKAQAGSGDL